MNNSTVWLRDVDGTGSMHPCAEGDPGAVEYAPALSGELPRYGHWFPNVFDAYLRELDCSNGWAKLPATFRWQEFWDRLRPEIEAARTGD